MFDCSHRKWLIGHVDGECQISLQLREIEFKLFPCDQWEEKNTEIIKKEGSIDKIIPGVKINCQKKNY